MKKIIKMLLLSFFMAIILMIGIMFEDFKIRMGVVIFIYLFSFFMILGKGILGNGNNSN